MSVRDVGEIVRYNSTTIPLSCVFMFINLILLCVIAKEKQKRSIKEVVVLLFFILNCKFSNVWFGEKLIMVTPS